MQFCIYFSLFFAVFVLWSRLHLDSPLQSNDFRTSLEEICYAALHDCVDCVDCVPDHFLEPNRSFLLGLGQSGVKQHEGQHRNDFPTIALSLF